MAINYDIALNNNDIQFLNGDFGIAESDEQHIIDTINAFQGWWKEYPADGVGLMAYQKSSGAMTGLNRSIKINLESDGYRVNDMVITLDASGNLVINPNAVKK